MMGGRWRNRPCTRVHTRRYTKSHVGQKTQLALLPNLIYCLKQQFQHFYNQSSINSQTLICDTSPSGVTLSDYCCISMKYEEGTDGDSTATLSRDGSEKINLRNKLRRH